MRRNVWLNLQVIGVEDGGFSRADSFDDQYALLVCVSMLGTRIRDFLVDKITVDGLDASKKFIRMLRAVSFGAVMLAGVSFAGFNLIDPTLVFEEFHKPIIIVSRTKPDNVAVKQALRRHFSDWRIRWAVFEKLGPIYPVVSIRDAPPLYLEVVGADLSWATQLIQALSTHCRIPEPIRVAKLIAHGLTMKKGVC